jgi:putative transposase
MTVQTKIPTPAPDRVTVRSSGTAPSSVCGGSGQLCLGKAVSSTWGGRRKGSGRKRVAVRPLTPHRARPPHAASRPVHVTLRARFRPLRSQHVLPTLRLAIDRTNRRRPNRFRVIEFTVQYDHMHLLVEAADRRELSSGMSSLAVRIARRVNQLVARRGRFWADRWYGRELTSPRQVRTALVYVLANFRKHARWRLGPGIDPFSSALWFDGWEGARPGVARSGQVRLGEERAPPVRRARTWLARDGWRLLGLLRLDEAPAGASRAVRSV